MPLEAAHPAAVNAGTSACQSSSSLYVERDGKGQNGSNSDGIMNRIMDELRCWLQLETFSFPPARMHWTNDVNNVGAIQSLLVLLLDFLKQAEIAEDMLVLELVNGAVLSEERSKEFMWWVLTTTAGIQKNSMEDKHQVSSSPADRIKDMDEALLGRELALCLRNYSCSRKILVAVAQERLTMFRLWAGAFSNGEARPVLEEIHSAVANVRCQFEKWALAVQFAKLCGPWSNNKESNMIPMKNLNFGGIQDGVDQLIKKVTSPPLPCFLPSSNDRPSSGNRCTRSCFVQSSYFDFTPSAPVHFESCPRSHDDINSPTSSPSSTSFSSPLSASSSFSASSDPAWSLCKKLGMLSVLEEEDDSFKEPPFPCSVSSFDSFKDSQLASSASLSSSSLWDLDSSSNATVPMDLSPSSNKSSGTGMTSSSFSRSPSCSSRSCAEEPLYPSASSSYTSATELDLSVFETEGRRICDPWSLPPSRSPCADAELDAGICFISNIVQLARLNCEKGI